MIRNFLRNLWILAGIVIAMAPSGAVAEEANDQALQSLQQFLYNTTERRAFASQTPAAQAANSYLESFPSWAQDELLAIIMEIMKQEGEKAARYGQTAATSGAAAAGQQMSPAIRTRVSALAKKLMNDSQFSNKENLKRMQQTMPIK